MYKKYPPKDRGGGGGGTPEATLVPPYVHPRSIKQMLPPPWSSEPTPGRPRLREAYNLRPIQAH